MKRFPKAITEHPGVQEIVSGEMTGADARYDIFLKEGWVFTHGSAWEYDWTRTCICNTVREFLNDDPIKLER